MEQSEILGWIEAAKPIAAWVTTVNPFGLGAVLLTVYDFTKRKVKTIEPKSLITDIRGGLKKIDLILERIDGVLDAVFPQALIDEETAAVYKKAEAEFIAAKKKLQGKK